MKILGIGVDFIENKRIRKSMKNKRFIQRIFNKLELNISKKDRIKNNFYAKRFATKESFAKALGTGIRKELFFKDIIILNDNLGKPFYKKQKLDAIIRKKFKVKNYNLLLSISDEKDYSIAFTILQKI